MNTFTPSGTLTLTEPTALPANVNLTVVVSGGTLALSGTGSLLATGTGTFA